jgi:ribosome-binding protein aMBF1 (putative translation factor)
MQEKRKIKMVGCNVCGGEIVEVKTETASMLVCKDCKHYNNYSFAIKPKRKIKKVRMRRRRIK